MRTLFSNYLALLVFAPLFFSAAVPASALAVSLTFLERGTGDPISKVQIYAQDSRLEDAASLYSDKKGTLEVPLELWQKLPPQLSFQRFGYDKFSGSKSFLNTNPTIYLRPKIAADNVITISAVKRKEVSRKIVSVEEAEIVASGGEPTRITATLPGVQTRPFQGEVIVRGSAPEDTRYYIDDLLVPAVYHGVGSQSVLPPQLLDNVQISTGGFGAYRGEATGGVVELQTKSQLPEKPLTTLTVNLPFYTGVLHERSIGKGDSPWGLWVGARKSTIEYALRPIFEGMEDQDLSVVPFFADGTLMLVQPRENGLRKLKLLYYLDGIELATNNLPTTDSSGRGQLGIERSYIASSYRKEYRLNKKWKYVSEPQYIFDRIRNEFSGDKLFIDIHEARLFHEWQFRYKTGGQKRARNKLSLGVEPSLQWGKVDIDVPRGDPQDPFFEFEEADQVTVEDSFSIFKFGLWGSLDHQLGKWLVQPGFRVQYNGQIDAWSIDPRLSAFYELNKKHSLKAAAGLYSISPREQESTEPSGNPDLELERSRHFVLGWESQWTEQIKSSLEVFYKWNDRMVQLDALTNYVGSGRLRVYGVEVFLRRLQSARFFGWLSYTYSKADLRKASGEPEIASPDDQRHVLQLVSGYKLSSTFRLGARLLVQSGKPFSPVGEVVYHAGFDSYQGRLGAAENENSERLPGSQSLDLFAQKDFLLKRWKLRLRAGAEFISYERPVFGVEYDFDFRNQNEFKGFAPIPYLEVRSEF